MPDSRKDELQSQVTEYLGAPSQHKAGPVNGAEKPAVGQIAVPLLHRIQFSEQPHREWFFGELMPEGCFLVFGRPKVGKSWLLLQMALAAAGAAKLLGFEPLGAFGVLYVCAEDDQARIQSRVDKYRVSQIPPAIHLILRDTLSKLAAQYSAHYTFAEFLDQFLAASPGIKIVIIDTESTVKSAWGSDRDVADAERGINRKDYAEVREFDELAHRRHVFLALVNHTAKRKTTFWIDPHETINRTNTALAGGSGDWVLLDPPGIDPVEDQGDGCKVLAIRGRDLPKEYMLAVQQDEFGIFQNLGPYKLHRQTEAENAIMEALEHLTKEGIQDAWYTAKEIAVEVGKNAAAVQRAVSRMKRAGKHTWRTYYVETQKKKGVRLLNKGQS